MRSLKHDVRAVSLGPVHEFPGDFCKAHSSRPDIEILVRLKKKKEKAIAASSQTHILHVALIGIFGLGTNIIG